MTTVSPEQAIARVRRASRDAEPFEVARCKQKCREAYDVPSDGSQDAAQAWTRTKRRHPLSFRDAARLHVPRGALVWWLGGSADHGHVAISAGDGKVWSTDLKRPGHWDLVHIDEIARAWRMSLVGWSEDIDGIYVLRSRGKRVDKAERALEGVIYDHGDDDKGDYARHVLRALRTWRLA